MRKNESLSKIYLLLLTFIFISSCFGQSKTQTSSSWSEAKGIEKSNSKIVKNHFITEYPDEFFFIQCGLQDKKRNMWFGSAGDGIYYYDVSLPEGKAGFINFTGKDGLCHNDILCCLEDKSGIIWFGTRNGLIRYKPSGKHPERKNFINFLISENAISNTTRKKIPYTYVGADNFVWSMMQDKSGKIWFGTNNGVYIHNPSTDMSNDTPRFTQFLDNNSLVNNKKLQLNEVTSMLEDKSGTIWFVSGYSKGEGICRYNYKTLTNFKPDGIKSFRTIIERKNGDLLFLSTFHGVYSYDACRNKSIVQEKSFTNLTEKIGIKNDTLIAMLEDKAGTLWFGRNSDNIKNGGEGGVWRYDNRLSSEEGKSLKLFTTKDGLSHNCIFCIVEERDGKIWFGTRNTGLCRYNAGTKDKQGKYFTNFSE